MSCSITGENACLIGLKLDLLENAISRNKKLLCIVSEYDYLIFNTQLIYYLINERGMGGVYITMNTSSDVILNMLATANVNMNEVYVIDCVLRTIGDGSKRGGRCFFVDSPKDLLGIGMALTEISERMSVLSKEMFLFVDALALRGMLNALHHPFKVAHFIEQRCLLTDIKVALLCVERGCNKKVVKALASVADEVVDLSRQGSFSWRCPNNHHIPQGKLNMDAKMSRTWNRTDQQSLITT